MDRLQLDMDQHHDDVIWLTWLHLNAKKTSSTPTRTTMSQTQLKGLILMSLTLPSRTRRCRSISRAWQGWSSRLWTEKSRGGESWRCPSPTRIVSSRPSTKRQSLGARGSLSSLLVTLKRAKCSKTRSWNIVFWRAGHATGTSPWALVNFAPSAELLRWDIWIRISDRSRGILPHQAG